MTSVDPNNNHAGVKWPPPVFLFGSIALMYVMERLVYPLPLAYNSWLLWVGRIILTAGIILMTSCAIVFKKNKVSIEPWKPTTKLMIVGAYRFSRNPIYLGFLLVHLGLGLMFQTQWLIPLGILLYIALRYYVIAKEERYLEKRFGKDYTDYKAKARRWI